MVRFDQAGRGYRTCREWYPRRDEALYIELLFGQTYREPLITGEPWRVVPDPCAHLLFVAGGSAASGWTREPTLRLVGPRSTYVDIDNTGRTIMLGVRLRPGVLASLMGSDARNLTDQSASAEELFGKAGRELLDRVASSLIPESATRDLAAFVVGRVCSRPRRGPDPTILADALTHTVSIDATADAMGVTPRAVHRCAVSGIGLAPKRLVRIQRLHRALALMLTPRSWPMATAAAEAGYADQAHLSRDCSELLGESPARFLSRGVRNVQEFPAVSA
jgi:AraC-like DNA-binding protein